MANILSKGSLFPEELIPGFIQKTTGASALAKLCGATPIPFNGQKEFTFTLDKEVDIVAENGAKGTGGLTVEPITIVPLKIEYGARVSDEFLYASEDAQMDVLSAFADGFAKKVAKGLDLMAFHGINPRTGTASGVIGTDAYAGLVAADADIAEHNGILNGWVLSPKGKALLLNAVDGNKRPLFINNVAEGAVPMILGSRTLQSKGAYLSGTPDVVGFAGDWTQAMYGTVEGVQIAIADQATLQDGEDTINLFQQNMFAVRAEIEVGFRCDTTVFNKLTKAAG